MNVSHESDLPLHARIGGHAALEQFVAQLYQIMAREEDAKKIWAWHPQDMENLKGRLVAFLSGFVGGPSLYHHNFGPPMMRRRHLNFPIGPQERDAWLKCAAMAADETIKDADAREDFNLALRAMADHMRNCGAAEQRP